MQTIYREHRMDPILFTDSVYISIYNFIVTHNYRQYQYRPRFIENANLQNL